MTMMINLIGQRVYNLIMILFKLLKIIVINNNLYRWRRLNKVVISMMMMRMREMDLMNLMKHQRLMMMKNN